MADIDDAKRADREEWLTERTARLIESGMAEPAARELAAHIYDTLDAYAEKGELAPVPVPEHADASTSARAEEQRLLDLRKEAWVADLVDRKRRAWLENERTKKVPFDVALARRDAEAEYTPQRGLDRELSLVGTTSSLYGDFEARVRILHADGYTLIEANQMALAEMLEGSLDARSDDHDACDDEECGGHSHDELGESVVSLMDTRRKTKGGGGSKGRRRSSRREPDPMTVIQRLICDQLGLAEREVSRMSIERLSTSPEAMQSAERAINKSDELSETRQPGRPRKGRACRIMAGSRIDPEDAATLREAGIKVSNAMFVGVQLAANAIRAAKKAPPDAA